MKILFQCRGIFFMGVVADVVAWTPEDLGRDNGNDFSFLFPFPFPKLNDNDEKSFLNEYPKI